MDEVGLGLAGYSLGMSLPEAFLSRMQFFLGDEYTDFLDGYSQPAVLGLRVNTLKLSAQDFQILSPDSLSPIPWCPSGFFLPFAAQPGKHPFHAAGVYYLQDPSAMAAAELLTPRPGERVLDLAAAPGGKTTHIAALMQNRGLLVANEIHPQRVWDLAENLERCGVTNAVVLNETPSRLAEHFGAIFDRVLVDAPCSGEGMFRKSKTARGEWSTGLVKSCATRQIAILGEAARLIAPGGTLAYTTCTFAPEENEGVVDRFLKDHPGFALVQTSQFPGFTPGRPAWAEMPGVKDTSEPAPETSPSALHHTIRLWPHLGAPEGHFIAVLQRRNTSKLAGEKTEHRYRPGNLPAGQLGAFTDFWRDNLNCALPAGRLALRGSYLYRLPEDLPAVDGLKVIHPGWWLGVMKKKRFEPSHALAMALAAGDARRAAGLPVESAPAYLQGDIFVHEGEKGWVLVNVEANGMKFPLGWGRRVDGVIKNEYPKGLRWLSGRPTARFPS